MDNLRLSLTFYLENIAIIGLTRLFQAGDFHKQTQYERFMPTSTFQQFYNFFKRTTSHRQLVH